MCTDTPLKVNDAQVQEQLKEMIAKIDKGIPALKERGYDARNHTLNSGCEVRALRVRKSQYDRPNDAQEWVQCEKLDIAVVQHADGCKSRCGYVQQIVAIDNVVETRGKSGATQYTESSTVRLAWICPWDNLMIRRKAHQEFYEVHENPHLSETTSTDRETSEYNVSVDQLTELLNEAVTAFLNPCLSP